MPANDNPVQVNDSDFRDVRRLVAAYNAHGNAADLANAVKGLSRIVESVGKTADNLAKKEANDNASTE